MHHTLRLWVSSLLFITAATPLFLAAEEPQPNNSIIIKDTAGIIRANETVESSGNVDFSLVDASGAPAEGTEVTLVMEGTGTTLAASAQAGAVGFQGVTPGAWIVSSSTPGITFTNVSVLSTTAAAAAAGGATIAGMSVAPVAIGGAAVAAGAGVAVASNSSNNNEDETPISRFR